MNAPLRKPPSGKTPLRATPALGFFILVAATVLGNCRLPVTFDNGRHALVIGISDYQTAKGLTYPAADAASMKSLLEMQGWTVDILTNSGATKSAIKAKIESFFKNRTKDALSLVYYSGHGTLSSKEANDHLATYGDFDNYEGDIGEAWLAPYDINLVTWTGGISAAEMNQWMADYIDSRNRIFIADSCHSGGFVSSGESIDELGQNYYGNGNGTIGLTALAALPNFAELMARNAEASGTLAPISISAAGAEEYSYDGTAAMGHGVFTYFLLQSAYEGDANGDGFVSCTEAYTYVARAIEKKWNGSGSHRWSGEAFYPHISGGIRDLVLFGYSQGDLK